MSQPEGKGKEIARSLLLVLWGMGTLVLIAAVILLVTEMVRSGHQPLDSLTQPAKPTRTTTARNQPEDILISNLGQAQLYFANAPATRLTSIPETLELGASTIQNCRRAVEALIEGPPQGMVPVLPESTTVRALYLLEDRILVIDLSGNALADLPRSASAELLMIQGVVHTVMQPALRTDDGVVLQRVRLLIEGGLPEDYLPGEPRQIDLSIPFTPDASMLESAPGAPSFG